MAPYIHAFILSLFIASISAGAVRCPVGPTCPFNDLTAEEIKAVVRIVRTSGIFPPNIQFPIVRAQEPKKSDWLAGTAFNQRHAYTALFNLATNTITELVLDLKSETIIEVTEVADGISPAILQIEYAEAEAIIRANVTWQEAVFRRGISPDDAYLDIWAPGPLSPAEHGAGKRIMRAIVNYKDPKSRFAYWAVLEGLIVTVDLVSGQVTEILNDTDVLDITSPIEELPDFLGKPPLKPLLVSQPAGSSILIRGQQVNWYKWNFQYSVDPIFGLMLYHVSYHGDCEERQVLYKLSMSEMFVPYGAGGPAWRWRSAFDAGEYGIGKNANSLTIGLDVPENAILLDCVVADDAGGEPAIVRGCVAAFERDLGVLYRHTDLGSGDTDARRGRALVLTFMTTIANYDYTYDYVFNMDGSIEVRSRLTGILLARGSEGNAPSCVDNCTNPVNDYLVGPPHQHFFNYRLDLDVDGSDNHAVQVDLTSDPIGAENPDSGVFSAKKELMTEEGFRDHDFTSHRSWHVINTNSRNDFGSPRGYALKPETVSFTYLTDQNPFLEHAQFVTHPVWLTTYKDDEQTATDRFPRTGTPMEGLPKHIGDKESLVNTDLVLWYTYGVTHSTRPEEWPIMNVHTAGFSIIPFNFLSQNSEMPLRDRCAKKV